MAGRPAKVLEPDGSARTDLAIRMRRAKGNVTLREISANTNYATGYLQQVFSATTTPSRPVVEACLMALKQDLFDWEPYIAAALAGGAAVQDPADSNDRTANDTGPVNLSPSAELCQPSSDPVAAASAATGGGNQTPPDLPAHSDGQTPNGSDRHTVPSLAASQAVAVKAGGDESGSQIRAGSRRRRDLIAAGLATALLVTIAIIVARWGSTNSLQATEVTSSSPSVSADAQGGDQHPESGADPLPATANHGLVQPGYLLQEPTCPSSSAPSSSGDVLIDVTVSESDGCWSTTMNVARTPSIVRVQIAYRNGSSSTQNDVVIASKLPSGVDLIPNTTLLKNSTNPDGVLVASNAIASNGLVIGSYEPGAAGYVMFEVSTPQTAMLVCGDNILRLVGTTEPAKMDYFYNTADMNLTKHC